MTQRFKVKTKAANTNRVTQPDAAKKVTARSVAKSHGFAAVNLGVGLAFLNEFELQVHGRQEAFEISVSSACDCNGGKLPKLDEPCNIYLSEQRLGCAFAVESADSLEQAFLKAKSMIERARSGLYPRIAEHFARYQAA